MPADDNPCQLLANAIIAKAVDDYINTYPGSSMEKDVVRFFHSEWCETLIAMNPNVSLTGEEILAVAKRRRDEKRRQIHERFARAGDP